MMKDLNNKSQPIPSLPFVKAHGHKTRTGFYLIMILTLFLSCEKEVELSPEYGPAQEKQFGGETAIVRELSFNSGNFHIVGDLIRPAEGTLHPVIFMIHGSGDATRKGAVPFEPMIEIFLQNGFAVYSWDKPGSGQSTGEFEIGYTITERAEIIRDAIRVMIEDPTIDTSSIGLWGISQAGWVIPKVLTMTSEIDFIMIVSGGGEDGIEQGAYQVAQVSACAGESPEVVEKVEQYWPLIAKATSYEEYKEAAEYLAQVQSVADHTGITVSSEDQWNPWPPEIDAFFDPAEVLKETRIPVLAIFGALDKHVDPIQGCTAYESALEQAENEDYRIELIESAGHTLMPAETGCINEPVSGEYIPEYLDILDEWLKLR